MTISECDLFIYVGGESDEWVEDALSTARNCLTVRAAGPFSYFKNPDTQNEYFAVLIADITACCAQGIEFRPVTSTFLQVSSDSTKVIVLMKDRYY